MHNSNMNDGAAGLRIFASRSCWIVVFSCVFFTLMNCSPVPMGNGVSSRAAQADFETFPSVVAAQPDANEKLRSELHKTEIVPLKDGQTALRRRLEVMEGAQHSLDVSAFLIRQDNAGYLFADRLLGAADRGVKVRLLMDDLLNRSTAGRFLALDHHPNIEIRIFNPLSRLSPMPVSFLLDYERVARRMHSRLMIADREVVIFGGRNIGDEYFGDDGSKSFIDFELLARGSVVRKFSETFEMYWSDDWTVSIGSLGIKADSARFTNLLGLVTSRTKKALQSKYAAMRERAPQRAGREKPSPFVAQTEFVTDLPDKVRQDQTDGPFNVAGAQFEMLQQSEQDVLIVTPYFIPERYLTQILQSIAARGVKVTIVTNSLASTNHPAVHGGYSSYREKLIRSGVEFHELKPGGIQGIQNTLHAKFTVIDGAETIVTTMNFDPVSIKGNLETSLTVRSRAFAQWMTKRVNPVSDKRTYRLKRDEHGSLVWFADSGAGSAHKHSEPGAGLTRRLISDFSKLFRLESML